MNEILVVAGASAAGKTTVAHALIKKSPRYELVRSLTTREVRPDTYSAEYIYITREEFEEKIKSDGVLEYTEYAGSLYGTPRSEIERILNAGGIPLLILDLRGVESLSRADGVSPCAVYIYDDIDLLEQRLYDRYLGDSPTVGGLAKFASRKEQNISDYISLPTLTDGFYAFLKNDAAPEESADRLALIFRSFTDGEPRKDAENANIAASLRDSALQKTIGGNKNV